MLIKSRWVVRFKVGLRQVVRLARKIDRSTKRFFSFARLSTLAPFFVCIQFYWDFFYIYRFRIADEFCSCLYSRKCSKKIFTKILIGDFRFLCKKRISKDKFGIKMLGNVYTEEINKSWLCRSRVFYPYYFIVISWCNCSKNIYH